MHTFNPVRTHVMNQRTTSIFLVHIRGIHYLHIMSVPADIQEPPDEDESVTVTEEPEQRDDESNPISDSELVN
jgi:hypothetical protein